MSIFCPSLQVRSCTPCNGDWAAQEAVFLISVLRLSCRLLLPGLSLCRVFLSKAETPFFQLCAPILCHLADDVWGLFSVVFHFYVLLVSLAKEEKESRSLRQEGDAGRNSRVDVSEPCVLFTRRLRSLALGLAEVVRRLLEVTGQLGFLPNELSPVTAVFSSGSFELTVS